ncbi:MAG TPA: type VI secretion system-associated FHA domain protein TagH [Burkholderiales bacterium]|jgi:type VI secretion system protein|nr:type VI secretion system-associated FHA domain protein TagH [Burkholderiales bacterium]
MAYVVTVEARAEGRLARPERRTVNTSRMTIGRGAECSVRLDDTKKHVSRVHAVVDLQGAGHVLTVMSTVNPVMLNGARIGPNETAPVKADDVIEIGDFAVQILEVHEAQPTPGASAARQMPASPFDFGLSGSGDTTPGDDPFRGLDDLLPPKQPPPAPRPDAGGLDSFQRAAPARPERHGDGLVEGLGGMSHLDLGSPGDSTDPLASLLSSATPVGRGSEGPSFNPQPFGGGPASLDQILARGPAAPIGQPLADMMKHQGAGASNIDHVQPLNVAYNAPSIRAEPRNAPPEVRKVQAKAPRAQPKAPDPFDGFDPFASLVGRRPAELVPPVEEIPEPQAREEELAPPAPAPRAEAVSPAAAASAVAAFLEGAGLAHLKISEADADTFLRESGAIVRACVEGLIGLLLARSELKKEMRAEDRTMVASRDNNPLKLMTDPRDALSYLFDKRERLSGAFLPPVQAVGDACDDLRVHEIALMAGMRAAFQGALKRFDPQLVEREADKQKGSFTLNKKVKLWETFVAHHEKLTRDAEDDLLKVFGKEFLGTYMAQVRRLRSGPKH